MIQTYHNNQFKIQIQEVSISMKKCNLSNSDCRILNWFGLKSPNWFIKLS